MVMPGPSSSQLRRLIHAKVFPDLEGGSGAGNRAGQRKLSPGNLLYEGLHLGLDSAQLPPS